MGLELVYTPCYVTPILIQWLAHETVADVVPPLLEKGAGEGTPYICIVAVGRLSTPCREAMYILHRYVEEGRGERRGGKKEACCKFGIAAQRRDEPHDEFPWYENMDEVSRIITTTRAEARFLCDGLW